MPGASRDSGQSNVSPTSPARESLRSDYTEGMTAMHVCVCTCEQVCGPCLRECSAMCIHLVNSRGADHGRNRKGLARAADAGGTSSLGIGCCPSPLRNPEPRPLWFPWEDRAARAGWRPSGKPVAISP